MIHAEERRAVVDLCVELSRRRYLAATGGNVMLRIGGGLVAVTPSGTDYLTMTPADVCVLRLDDLSRVDGELAPSIETGMHAGVLRRRPDVGCSIHTHQPVASACTLLGRTLAVPPHLVGTIGATVPLVGYRPSGTAMLARLIARAVRPATNAYLLKSHGVLCLGMDMTTALHAVEALEAVAREHLLGLIRAADDGDGAATLTMLDKTG